MHFWYSETLFKLRFIDFFSCFKKNQHEIYKHETNCRAENMYFSAWRKGTSMYIHDWLIDWLLNVPIEKNFMQLETSPLLFKAVRYRHMRSCPLLAERGFLLLCRMLWQGATGKLIFRLISPFTKSKGCREPILTQIFKCIHMKIKAFENWVHNFFFVIWMYKNNI